MSTENKPLLRHVVCFRFKDHLSPSEIQSLVDDFLNLKRQIPQIADSEGGRDVSIEGLAKGYSHCFVISFLSEKDRDDYLQHPIHQEFAKMILPQLADVLAIDFWQQA